MYLYQIILFIIHKKTEYIIQYIKKVHKKYIKSSHSNNKFKISALTYKDNFKLPGGSYSVSYIQDYFEHILKNMDNHW